MPYGSGSVRVLGHTGVDFDAHMGTPAYACWSGRIETGWDQYGFGNYLIIHVDDGRRALYAHLDRYAPIVWQRAYAGQLIAYTGQSGNATGPHLHFEIYEANADMANGFRGCRDPLVGFDHAVIPSFDFRLV